MTFGFEHGILFSISLLHAVLDFIHSTENSDKELYGMLWF